MTEQASCRHAKIIRWNKHRVGIPGEVGCYWRCEECELEFVPSNCNEPCDAPKGSVCLTCAAEEAKKEEKCRGCSAADGVDTFCETHHKEAAMRMLDAQLNIMAKLSGMPRSEFGKQPERDYYTKQEVEDRIRDSLSRFAESWNDAQQQIKKRK